MLRALAVLLALCFANLPVLHAVPAPASPVSQDQPPPPDQSQDQPQYQQQGQPQDQGPAYENFSPEQLDNLLSPIALYPDPLLAQLFIAATFPDQVEEAARYVPMENLALSPQCGFASTAEGNLITEDRQWAKLGLVADTARRVWG